MHIISRTVDKKFDKIKIHKTIILGIFSILFLSRDFADFDVILKNLRYYFTFKKQIKTRNYYESYRVAFTKALDRY